MAAVPVPVSAALVSSVRSGLSSDAVPTRGVLFLVDIDLFLLLAAASRRAQRADLRE